MSPLPRKNSWIYIKDNGAVHNQLRTRAFGAVAMNPGDYPILDVQGRELTRTWSLLSSPMKNGDVTMKLLHKPDLMGWNVGDKILLLRQNCGLRV